MLKMSLEITKESIQQINLRRPLTQAQLNYAIENWSDDDEEIDAITIMPPEIVDENTDEDEDEECLDEDIIPMNDEIGIVNCAGTFEVTTVSKRTGEKMVCYDDVDVSEIVATSSMNIDPPVTRSKFAQTTTTKRSRIQAPVKPRLAYRSLSSFGAPKWTKKRNSQRQFDYEISPDPNGVNANQAELYNNLKDKSPRELFCLLFDNEVLNMIVDETNRYAQQKNSDFKVNQIDLKRFLGILVLSSFHTVPAISDYWSSDPALGVPVVKLCMNKNRFLQIKKYLQISKNYTEMDKSDKLVKWCLRPFYELINKKFMQFAIWTKDLTVDEQMVPYFDRNSSKTFIRGKPIRFGYKLWCLSSACGYLYSCMPYSGSSANYDKQVGLGADVVLRLLDNVEHPSHHVVYFNNFFTSYHLMCLLTEKKLCATGTVRSNRTYGATMKTGTQLERGDHDFQFDSNNKILICNWQDNKEVTVATNFDQIEPKIIVDRWKKEKKNKERQVVEAGRFVNYHQPLLLHNYNRGRGGVDQHDNAAGNHNINIRSKKCYWPLWMACLNSTIVNAWKLSCFVRCYKNQPIIPQKDFRVDIANFLIMTPSGSDEGALAGDDTVPMEGDIPPDDHPSNLPQHLIIKIENGKKRRCQYSQCHKPASYMCKSCNIALHINCFKAYHIEKNIEK